jgi:hypothetical protein
MSLELRRTGLWFPVVVCSGDGTRGTAWGWEGKKPTVRPMIAVAACARQQRSALSRNHGKRVKHDVPEGLRFSRFVSGCTASNAVKSMEEESGRFCEMRLGLRRPGCSKESRFSPCAMLSWLPLTLLPTEVRESYWAKTQACPMRWLCPSPAR